MTTGEVKVRESQNDVVLPKLERNNPAEFAETVLESEVLIKEKLASNIQVKEKFSRLKKSLRRKSVSIL